jgi:hypothetical protein
LSNFLEATKALECIVLVKQVKTATFAQHPVFTLPALFRKRFSPILSVPRKPIFPYVDEGSFFDISFNEFARHAWAPRYPSVMQDASDHNSRPAVMEFVTYHALPFWTPIALFAQSNLDCALLRALLRDKAEQVLVIDFIQQQLPARPRENTGVNRTAGIPSLTMSSTKGSR